MRILIIRRDNIGDLLCTTPLFDALRANMPTAYIAALVNSYNAPVLARNPALNAAHVYTKLKHREPGSSVLGPLLARLALIRRLRSEHFDVAILARSGFDRHGLNFVRLLGIPRVIGFAPKDGSARGISDPLSATDNAQLHEVEAVWRLMGPLGISAAPGPLRVFPDTTQMVDWRRKLGADNAPMVAVHISAREASRQLSTVKWIELLRGLHAGLPATRLALFWSPGDENDPRHPGDDRRAGDILSACADLGVTPCRTASLDDLIASLSCCSGFVGADGGALHVAVACRLPVVALFENSPYKLAHWYPWQVPHEIVASPTFAIGDIETQIIVAATLRLLSEPRPSSAQRPPPPAAALPA